MSHLRITGVGLEQLKVEAIGCKDSSKCNVELTIGEARMEIVASSSASNTTVNARSGNDRGN